jgi:hypothetical protein
MPWITVEQAARLRRTSTRRLWRLIRCKELDSQTGEDGRVLIWSDEEIPESEPPYELGQIEIPAVENASINEETLMKVEAMLESIRYTKDITSQEEELAFRAGLPAKTQERYKAELRRLYGLPAAIPLASIARHSQIRQALEYIITPRPKEKGKALTSGRGLVVARPTGEYISLSDWLLSIFSWEKHNAVSCYRALIMECRSGRIVRERDGKPAGERELPCERSVRRWLFAQDRNNLAVRRGRMTRARWETKEQIFASSDPEEHRVGGRLIGDHTELDTLVYRNDGRMAPMWLTCWIDYRSTLVRGWELAYRPNSGTIAISFKRAVTGKQLRVCTTGSVFAPVQIPDAPDVATVDNGKDYRSKYTKQVFGKVDFSDEARRTIQRISRLQYAMKHHPQSKAQQERFFGVIQEITKYLPGYKGAKYQDKPDELKEQIKRGELLTEDQFRELFARTVDAYNNRPKRSLDNMSPMEFTLTHQGTQRHVDERVLDFLMMKVSGRTVTRGQVRHLGLEYYSRDLLVFNGERAILYYDPADIGMVAVYVKGKFVTVAVNKRHVGENERSWLAIVKERAKLDKQVGLQLAEIRRGLTSDEAKAMLFAGELASAKAVPPELLQKRTPAVVVMTGLESESGEVKRQLAKQKEVEEAEKKSRELIRKKPLSIADVSKMR